MKYYILKDKIPIPTDDVKEWAKWYESNYNSPSRRVNYTDIDGDIEVSTVFTGLDSRIPHDEDNPRVFETLIIGGKHNREKTMSSTWEEAEKTHEQIVNRVKTDL